MKLKNFILLIAMAALVGCKTATQPAPKTVSIMPPGVVAAPVRTITLVWNPNYTVAGEATEIFESPDLTIPVSGWRVAFEGATNRCSLPMTGAREFFIAANDVTN